MQDMIGKLEVWNKKFHVTDTQALTIGSLEVGAIRYKLMNEENVEYLMAVKNCDMIEIADAVTDMLFVLVGTITKHGLQDVIGDLFEEVWESNMSKLGKDGLPIFDKDGKLMKGPNYFKPKLREILDAKVEKITNN